MPSSFSCQCQPSWTPGPCKRPCALRCSPRLLQRPPPSTSPTRRGWIPSSAQSAPLPSMRSRAPAPSMQQGSYFSSRNAPTYARISRATAASQTSPVGCACLAGSLRPFLPPLRSDSSQIPQSRLAASAVVITEGWSARAAVRVQGWRRIRSRCIRVDGASRACPRAPPTLRAGRPSATQPRATRVPSARTHPRRRRYPRPRVRLPSHPSRCCRPRPRHRRRQRVSLTGRRRHRRRPSHQPCPR
jgi:hypothetical protein